jgi:hypothetical protein
MAGLASELRGVMTHRPPVPFAEGVDGIHLVDVIAEPIEELVAGKPAQLVACADVSEALVQLAGYIGDVREARAALSCGSAWKRDPVSGVIGVEKGPLIPVV